MATPSPRLMIAKPARPKGVLSVPASSTQRKNGPNTEPHIPRAPLARLKLIIRRLPPGLTQIEFEEALGDDWKVGGDKVGWAMYKPGKVSKDPAKPSRPSRAYLHLTKQEHINLLSEKVRNTTFNDAKGSYADSVLLGPPSVEFAPFNRVPNSKPRKDARQGTIDQDPELIDFLESLTNPIAKPATDQEDEAAGKGKEKPTVTPLIQFLREKKANKGKSNATAAKDAKHARHDSKDINSNVTAGSKTATPNTTMSSPKKRSAQAVKVEQAARDAVKVLNKQGAGAKGSASPAPSSSAPTTKTPVVTPNSTANAVLAEKKRERGNASAAARILQRDLGLGGHAGGRRVRGGRNGQPGTPEAVVSTANAKREPLSSQASKAAESAVTPMPANSPASVQSSSTPSIATKANQTSTEPAASRAPAVTPTAHVAPQNATPKATPPASTATKAFLKHANPSQGITEPLLEQAFSTFGTIKEVEIDKKKGFAYVEFDAPETLQKAIKASPVKVAQGQVVVLERRENALPVPQPGNVRGGTQIVANRRRGGGGGGGPGGVPMVGRGGAMRGGATRGRGSIGRGSVNAPQSHNKSGNSAASVTPNPPSSAVTLAAAAAAAAAAPSGENSSTMPTTAPPPPQSAPTPAPNPTASTNLSGP